MAEETLTNILNTGRLKTGGRGCHGSVMDIGDLGMIDFLIEPTEYRGQIGSQYDEEGAVGQSYAHMAFKHTSNERIPITLYYSRILIMEEYGRSMGWTVDDVDHEMNVHRNFLRALFTPPTLQDGLVSTEPATCILIVPGVMHLPVRLVGLNWTIHQRDTQGRIMRMTMECQFVESSSRRWAAEEILERGYNRT